MTKTTGRIGHRNYPQVIAMIESRCTASQIAAHFGVFPETVRKFARRRGLEIEKQDQSMENHPSWAGGTTLDRSGYELQRVEVGGPYGYLIRALRAGDVRGYAPTHRIRMQEMLGRKLRLGEVVHHIDGDVSNNDPSNLDVFPDNATHLATTLKGKCPNWTGEGFERMQRHNRLVAVTTLSATNDRPKTDGQT